MFYISHKQFGEIYGFQNINNINVSSSWKNTGNFMAKRTKEA